MTVLHGLSDLDAAGARSDDPRVEWLRLDQALRSAHRVRTWEALERRAAWPTQARLFASTLDGLPPQGGNCLMAAWQGGDLAGLLPLCRDRGYFARWRMVGAREFHEPGDALCDGAAGAEGLAQAIARLRHPLLLDRISADSPLVPALVAAMRGRGRVIVRPAKACPFIALDADWCDPESRFNAGRRSDFRRARRRAQAHGALSFETRVPGADDFDALFDDAIRVEAMGWKCDGGTAIAIDRRQEALFRAYFRAVAQAGDFRVSYLRIDGRAVAMQMAVLWNGRYWLFKIGHDAAFNDCSPGGLLMLHALGWAAGQGLHGFEFLGVAESWINRLWTRDQHECVQLRTYPYSPRGATAFGADAAIWLRQQLR